ncbi:sugar ABC transporter substrate-binding protein [Massilia sp. KIM]|nr:sugar ABC transporter substrate-binding protein [Massilia sp. KIM]
MTVSLAAAAAGLSAPAEPLQVLHWWTSESERRAADLLAARLARGGVGWIDAAVPGGAGLGAGKVLKSRVLAGSAPDATQIIGVSISEWAGMGLLLDLESVAVAGNWDRVMFPTVRTLVRGRSGNTVAVPLGIHRINTVLYNRKLFSRLGLTPPTSWTALEKVAPVLRAAGVAPFVQSSEDWQVAALFENLVLSSGGPEFYHELFVRQSARAAADARLFTALLRLRQMKAWMAPVRDQPWTEVARRFANGEGAMLVMGDWAKAELNGPGFRVDADFACLPMPGTGPLHLYSVDTLAMFAKGPAPRVAAQEMFARTVMSAEVQQDYNLAKGSVPVRRDADTGVMDSCARASWTAFARGQSAQVPSLVHRMATGEENRDVIIAEVRRYFADDSVSAADVQKRLSTLFRTLNLRLDAHLPR